MAQFVRPTLEQSIQSGSLSVGRFTRVDAVTTTWFGTGSNAGGSAFIRGASATGTVSASFGGALDLTDLTVGMVYEIQPSAVSAAGGTVYVLYGASR
jgi:hypothetical protein